MVHKAGDGQDTPAQQGVRNIEIPILFVMGNADESVRYGQFRLRFLRSFLFLGIGILVISGSGLLGQGEGSRGHKQRHRGEEDSFYHIYQYFP